MFHWVVFVSRGMKQTLGIREYEPPGVHLSVALKPGKKENAKLYALLETYVFFVNNQY